MSSGSNSTSSWGTSSPERSCTYVAPITSTMVMRSSSAPEATTMTFRKILGIPLTFYWFCASAIFFRSNDIKSALQIEKAFLFFNSSGEQNVNIQMGWIFIPLVILHWAAYKGWFSDWLGKIPSWSFATGYGVLVAIILRFIAVDPQPFVYFQF